MDNNNVLGIEGMINLSVFVYEGLFKNKILRFSSL